MSSNMVELCGVKGKTHGIISEEDAADYKRHPFRMMWKSLKTFAPLESCMLEPAETLWTDN